MVEIEAQVEKITFRNPVTGYTVLKIRTKKEGRLVTAVGYMQSIFPGQILKLKGCWKTHEKYGEQFHFSSFEEDTERYIGSEDTIEMISQMPLVKKPRTEHEEEDVILSLKELGISHGLATKIFKHYGSDAVRIVKENPFRIAEDVYGVGFLTADKIARLLNIEKDSELRIEAGIHYVLKKAAEEGHVYYPLDKLIKETSSLLKVEEEKIKNSLPKIKESEEIVIDESYEEMPVYLKSLYVAETKISEKIKKISSIQGELCFLKNEIVFEEIQRKLGLKFTDAQQRAIKASVENKITIITGGPGTGKTTVIKGILEAYASMGKKAILCAPTGRAAKKMEESAGYPSQTIHRLLEYNPQTKSFKRNEKHPLNCDLIVVDECSMIDVFLMYHLMKAVPEKANLVFVGDVDQLPSVGPGNVFKDLIDSDLLFCVRLKEIFRQAEESLIVANAHRINNGHMPIFEEKTKKLSDFLFYQREKPEAILKTVVHLAGSYIPGKYGIPAQEIQVLTPMYRGVIGVSNLNVVLKDVINPEKKEIQSGTISLRLNDRVIQMRNNYEKEVFNGDIGKIIGIDLENREVKVSYDERVVSYDFSELDEIMPGYAISIHKSQGSEYEAVIVPVTTHHYILLQRNLLYTALTRAKKLAVFVGTKKALAIAIKNNKPEKRYTLLRERLKRDFWSV